MYMQMFIFHKNIQNEIPTEENIRIRNGTGTIKLVLKILYQFFICLTYVCTYEENVILILKEIVTHMQPQTKQNGGSCHLKNYI